jgi:hypothetical protein
MEAGLGLADEGVGEVAVLLVGGPHVEPGEEEGLEERLLEHVLAGPQEQLAVGGPLLAGEPAEVIGGGPEQLGDGLPRRPAGAELGGLFEEGVGFGQDGRDHDITVTGLRRAGMIRRIAVHISTILRTGPVKRNSGIFFLGAGFEVVGRFAGAATARERLLGQAAPWRSRLLPPLDPEQSP